jgi:hypothetical protein
MNKFGGAKHTQAPKIVPMAILKNRCWINILDTHLYRLCPNNTFIRKTIIALRTVSIPTYNVVTPIIVDLL